MSTPQTPQLELPKRLKTILIIILVVPLMLAAIFTIGQLYPATYVIGWITNDEGMFSLKLAILLNYLLSLLPILGVLLVGVGLKRLFFSRPA